MIYTIKGLFKVTKIPPITLLLFKAFRISLVNLYMALSADDLVLKPNYSSAKILFLFRWSRIWIFITFSSTLENEVASDIGL
jgi:hypothetical protein